MDRSLLLEDPQVALSGGELVVAGSRYDLGQIRSVELVRVPAAASGPILMSGVGVVCLLAAAGDAGVKGIALGLALLLGAGVWWTRKKPSFQVTLALPEGATAAFESRDEQTAARVLGAIQQARARAAGSAP
jgi:hypothetical protein